MRTWQKVFLLLSSLALVVGIGVVLFHRLGQRNTDEIGILAQSEPPTGISGRVVHLVTQEPIPDAAISVGSQEAYTDEQGFYELPLKPGMYDVTARAAGFIGMSQVYQQVTSNQTTVDFQMIPSDPDEEMADRISEAMGVQEQEVPPEIQVELAQGELGVSAITRLPATVRVAVRENPSIRDSRIVAIITLDFEEYIKGILPYEMSPAFPMEALKAQAVAARSYAAANLGKHQADGADVCSSVHCQVWRRTRYETTDRAVDETRGIAATYNGAIIYAFFHGHCDGHTRNVEDVWSSAVPYLRGVPCPCGYSTMYGHGVGMCQRGAAAMANAGARFDQIIRHYYAGVSLLSAPTATLTQGVVGPSTGAPNTRYMYRIRYTSNVPTPPPIANVIIDGRTHAMIRGFGNPETGWEYVYATNLAPGNHNYRFEFDDGYGRIVRAPASGVVAGPTVSAGAVPTPAAQGVIDTISASTASDWAGGQFGQVVIGREDKEVLQLAPGQTTGNYLSPILRASSTFVAYGLTWYATLPAGSAISIEARTSKDRKTWTPWEVAIGETYVAGNTRLWYAEPVFGEGRYVQYRIFFRAGTGGLSPSVRNVRIWHGDTRPGPSANDLMTTRADAFGTSSIITRAQWGANESWMTSPPEYRTVRTLVIHHTVTSDGGVDPAAIVRAIYRYHAVDLGWGDIGYNFLIDHAGRVYEGRFGGPGVVGHHAGSPYNHGSIGIGLIGNLDVNGVPPAMFDSAANLIAYESRVWNLNPVGTTYFIDRWIATVFGHRDVSSTACPGRYMYSRLPELRSLAQQRMAQQAPTVQLTSPANGKHVRGVVAPKTTLGGTVSTMTWYVDGVMAARNTGPFEWKWNTTRWADGSHQLRVVVENSGGSAQAIATVTVDNTPPTGSVTIPLWTNASYVPITVRSNNATGVSFSPGWTWEGEKLSMEPGTGTTAADGGASGGYARLGRAGVDRPGAWYGPYTCAFTPGGYDVLFRVRTDSNAPGAGIATLDVVDAAGNVTYSRVALAADDLVNTRYQIVGLPLRYLNVSPSCQAGKPGLEFRIFFSGARNLWYDQVRVFTAAAPLAATHSWRTPVAEGRTPLAVRLVDAAGNGTIYELSIGVDRTAPTWFKTFGSGVFVSDRRSGLAVAQAAWQQSLDGGQTWGAWQPMTAQGGNGTTNTVLYYSATPRTGLVRYKAVDLAGNVAISPAIRAGLPFPRLPYRYVLPMLTR
ncbi:MAG: SpoIID/LytB domain-containing protein [Anaerolineae bacterium]|nr:SpoIID/LytB domain-containing protein [Chloroflexota bacterium]